MSLTGEFGPGTRLGLGRRPRPMRLGSDQGLLLRGRPMIVLTSVGAKTGSSQDGPHAGGTRRDDAVVASLGGSAKHRSGTQPEGEPARRAPGRRGEARLPGRRGEGDEKAVWWERAVETWPDYARYQNKTNRRSQCSCSNRCDAGTGTHQVVDSATTSE